MRESVIEIRRGKSMVLDPADQNRRSCGSFFTNPIVAPAHADKVAARAGVATMPRWPQPDGSVRLSAAWLIERAGFSKGTSAGVVSLCTRHTVAIVGHAAACTADVVGLARGIRATGAERFVARLVPEPVLWGGLRLES